VPAKILDHAVMTGPNNMVDVDPSTTLKNVYFKLEFNKRGDGVQPSSTYYSYTLLKKKIPGMILDYVENMVHFD